MPVAEGVFTPRAPLTDAERHVDFPGHNDHIDRRRAVVENTARPGARRIAAVATGTSRVSEDALGRLDMALIRSLAATARFGYREAQREIAAARHEQLHRVLAAIEPAPSRYQQIVDRGIDGVLAHAATRAYEASSEVLAAVWKVVRSGRYEGTMLALEARKMAERTLHNRVLELVGETLNLGRTAGALSAPGGPPEFALRSEQLDVNTCDPCFAIHGTVTRVGSPQYFAILPPTVCLGGGRCRGIMVFADRIESVRGPDPTEQELERIRRESLAQ